MGDGEDGVGAARHPRCPVACAEAEALRLGRSTEGLRCAPRPRGRKMMIATMAPPKASMRYCSISRKSSKLASMARAAARPRPKPGSMLTEPERNTRGAHNPRAAFRPAGEALPVQQDEPDDLAEGER